MLPFFLTGTASGSLAEGSSFLAEIGVESCSDGPDDEAILLVHANCTSGHKNKTLAKQLVQLRLFSRTRSISSARNRSSGVR